MVSRETDETALAVYKQAWEERDPELIVTIFTDDATYGERMFEEPHRGREGIRQYWKDKVVGEQSNIRFAVTGLQIDGETAALEWTASFDNTPKEKRTTLLGAMFLDFQDGKISALREYWHLKRE